MSKMTLFLLSVMPASLALHLLVMMAVPLDTEMVVIAVVVPALIAMLMWLSVREHAVSWSLLEGLVGSSFFATVMAFGVVISVLQTALGKPSWGALAVSTLTSAYFFRLHIGYIRRAVALERP